MIQNRKLRDATEKGDFDLVKDLIENGADIETVNSFGFTALLQASHDRYTKIVDFLK